MVFLTRRERFNAAHRLFKPEWTNEQNYEVFGKCSNPNWHGHNYELFVTIKGEPNPETGFVINLKQLSKIVRTKITEQADHKNLNLEVPFMKGRIPTSENIAIAIWEEIEEDIIKLNCNLHSVKVVETENNSVEYFGK
jgi:6-pyruvoyltetrahydropterin/6-carboxytetrahydropterin synthase